MPRRRTAAAFAIALLYLGTASFNLLWPSARGPADNGDFARVFGYFSTGPVGERTWPSKHTDWEANQRRFFNDYHRFWRRDGRTRGLAHWSSSLLVPLPGLALSIGRPRFDLALNAFCVLLLLATCLFAALRALSGRAAFWALAASAFCLCDARVVAYVNSFYQESGAYVGVFLLACALPAFWERPGTLRLLAVGVGAAAVGLAKNAYALAIPLAVVPVAADAVIRRTADPVIRRRAVATGAVLAGLIATFLIFPKDLFVRHNSYQFIFSAALPRLPPEERGPFLSVLGFDSGAASLSGKLAYSPGSRLKDPSLSPHLTRRTQLRAVAELMRHHPAAFLRVLGDGFSAAGLYFVRLRPTFENRQEPLRAEARPWSWMRAAVLSGTTSYLAAFGLWLGLFAISRRAGAPETARFFLLASGGFFAASVLEVLVTILGDGRSDLYRHNYLANLLFDEAFVWSLAGAAAGLLASGRRPRSPAST